MKLSRTSLFAGTGSALASVCVPRYPAGAAEFTYKLGALLSNSDPLTARALEAAAKINRESNGRLEVQVFPNSVLGTGPAMVEQVRVGALEMFQCGNIVLANVAPGAAIDGLPFIFSSYEDAWRAADGPLGKYIRASLAKAGMYTFERM